MVQVLQGALQNEKIASFVGNSKDQKIGNAVNAAEEKKTLPSILSLQKNL